MPAWSRGTANCQHSSNIVNIFRMLHRYILGLSIRSCRHGNTASLRINSLLWPLRGLGNLVAYRNDGGMPRVDVEVSIEVFECSVGGFGVEEVDDKNECQIENRKNYTIGVSRRIPVLLERGHLTDVESISNIFNSRGCKLGADEAKELWLIGQRSFFHAKKYL